MRSLEALAKEVGALAGEAGKLAQVQAEAQAKALIEFYVPVERRDEAWRMVRHGERMAGTVADWAAQQGPWALAWKLWPQVKEAVEDEMRRRQTEGSGAPSGAASSS